MSSGTGGVLTVGSINVDLVVRVDHLPRPGETVIGGRFDRHGGGTGCQPGGAAARVRRSRSLHRRYDRRPPR